MTNLKEAIEKTEKIKPIAVENGIPIVSFEEQRDLAVLDKMTNPELGQLQMNHDGSVARTPVRAAAVNLDNYYINRYKKVKSTILVVTDYRAIKEQSTGSVYLKQIPAYTIARDAEGKLYLASVVNVSDSEFIADFTHTLNREAMSQIMPLIVNGVGVTADDLMI